MHMTANLNVKLAQTAVQKQLKQNVIDKPSTGNAKFLMGLNNRVAKLQTRLENIEHHITHNQKQQIGYKELALTLVLALLMFTSAVLAIRDLLPHEPSLQNMLLQGTQSETTTVKKSALSLLSTLSPSPDIQNWASKQLSTLEPPKKHYKWPLEKQNGKQNIQYSTYKHGLNIPAKLGDPVVSISDGKVMYSGTGIADYGNLILIQHAENIISVYGNNYSNYVREGDSIKAGQLIAAVGEMNGKQAALYFEIRYQGKAEDPFLYF